jgi:hypothetical protein
VRPAFRDSAHEAQYRHEGYLVVPLLSRAEVAALAALYDETASGVANGFYTTLWSPDVQYRERVHREIGRVLEGPVARLIDNYRLVLANFVVKHPTREDSRVPLHQDWSVIDEQAHLPVSFWCPLVDVDSRNGCLAIVPRSHRLSSGPRPNQPHGVGYSPFRDLHQKIEADLLREIPIKAGEAIVYSPALLHASQGNRSESTRVAVASIFIPAEARLQHYFQNAPEQIDVFDVPEEFYWRDVVLASPPAAAHFVGSVRACNQPLSESEFDERMARVK